MKLKSKNKVAENPKRVFLADHFSMVRLSVADWLRQTPDLAVCGQADNAAKALKSIQRLKPDIVVTEIFGNNDCRFIQALHQQHPRLPILVFSSGDETWFAPRVLQAGADGYMLKGVSAKGLVDGIRRTLEGRLVLSPNMRYQLLMKCMRHKHAPGLVLKYPRQCRARVG